MPPKSKFTREEIIKAALEMMREEGLSSVTARALGQRLGSSARPIFTVFSSMEEVQQAVLQESRKLYNQYVQRGLACKPAFKGVGMEYLRFATEEPKLFQLLFMSEQPKETDTQRVLPVIDDNYQQILASIVDEYGFNQEEAAELYQHLWIYTHGIAALCVTKTCRLTLEESSIRLTEIFTALLKDWKGRKQA